MALASVNWGFPAPFICAHPSPVWEPLRAADDFEVIAYRCGRCKTYIPLEAALARREEEANGLVPDLRLRPAI